MITFFEIINEKDDSLKIVYNVEGQIVTDHLAISRFVQNSREMGIRWGYNGAVIQILKPGFNIKGVPSAEHNKVITVEHKIGKEYPEPLDAVIYNIDGSIDKYVELPNLVSDLAAKYYQTNYPKTMFFEGVRLEKEKVVLSIVFAMNWREERLLDPATGEIGQCLSSGMR